MTAPSTVTLTLPREWVEVDPREPDVLGALTRQLDVPPGTGDAVEALLAPLCIRLARMSAAADLVLAGFYSEVVEIPEGDPFVMTAQVTLALSPPVGNLDRLPEVVGGDGIEVRPVDLPAGRGVLAAGSTEVDDESWDAPQPAYLRRYFVPVAGLDRVAALSFLTPNVALVEEFTEVFDAIAETLAFA
ncbi:MAG: hypothetical protein L0H84_18370 [Pseudonocardia sp.]|nr:hypothetical protein [Pseudonocardia sp.]